ncbi:MAG TPA: hypothetical protein VM367_01890 [Pseudonocardia sp.]|jgi:hypothetical protein|nr:hypothetical protein [Pseudonocardia sp.]
MPRTRAQIEQAAADAEAWLDQLDQLDPDDPDVAVDDPADLRAIAYALAAVASADQAVAQAVNAARARGRTWGDIAMILGTSRQAAQKRYEDAAPPRTADPGAETGGGNRSRKTTARSAATGRYVTAATGGKATGKRARGAASDRDRSAG